MAAAGAVEAEVVVGEAVAVVNDGIYRIREMMIFIQRRNSMYSACLLISSRKIWSLAVISLLLAGVAIASPVSAQGSIFEQPPVFRASSLLPPDLLTGASYKLKEEVTMEGMLFSFDLWSRYGWYHPQSLDMLKIRLAEIRALDALTAMKQDPLFLEGVWDQAKGTGESTIDAVKHPFKTVANIPLGLHKFGKQVHARTLEGDTLPDDEVRFIHEKAKRELAVSLGVDPYSDNRPLQEALNQVATNKNRGALATRIGTAFIPAAGPALGAAQLNKGLQERLASLSSSELQVETRKNLIQLGVSKSETDLFIRNPGYSPSVRAAITEAMEGLAGVSGVQNYIHVIQEVPAPEVALFFQRRIQLAEKFHRSVRPLDKMITIGATPVFLDRNGNIAVGISVDYLYWNENLASRIKQIRAKLGKARCDLCITGTCSPLAKEKLAALGITVHEEWGKN